MTKDYTKSPLLVSSKDSAVSQFAHGQQKTGLWQKLSKMFIYKWENVARAAVLKMSDKEAEQALIAIKEHREKWEKDNPGKPQKFSKIAQHIERFLGERLNKKV